MRSGNIVRVCVSIDAKLQPSQTIIHQSQENIITSTPQQLFLNITNILEEGNIHVDGIGITKLDTFYTRQVAIGECLTNIQCLLDGKMGAANPSLIIH